jgi:hypothetical protein
MPKRTVLDARIESREAMALYDSICKRAKGTVTNALGETENNEREQIDEVDFVISSIEERGSTVDHQQSSSGVDDFCCLSASHLGDRSSSGDTGTEEWFDDQEINLNQPFEETEEWEERVSENLDLTLFSAHTIILWFILEANLSRSSVEKLLKVIQMFLPFQNKLAKSKHLLFKALNKQMKMDKYYICRDCSFISKKNNCNIHNTLDEFIMWSNPIDTFKERLQTDERFFSLCQYYREHRGEIIKKGENGNKIFNVWNAQQYQHIADPITKDYDGYSFIVNEDGASKWKSSICSANPIYLQNQEMEITERLKEENAIFCGAYYGKKKLNGNLLFSLLIKNFIEAEAGVSALKPDGTKYTLRARLINTCFDNPSLSNAMQIKQAGGESCCFWCNNQGCTIENRRCYPYLKEVNGSILNHARRTEAEIEDIYNSFRTQREQHHQSSLEPVRGLKDLTVFKALPYFRWTTSSSVELLHFVEGVFKIQIKLWLYPKYNDGTARISSDKWNEFEELLLLQRLPELFSRKIRSVSVHFKYYKATEALIFLLYTSQLLSWFEWFQPYKEHHIFLIHCLTDVLTPGKTVQELDEIKKRFTRWLVGFQRLYGPKVSIIYPLQYMWLQ